MVAILFCCEINPRKARTVKYQRARLKVLILALFEFLTFSKLTIFVNTLFKNIYGETFFSYLCTRFWFVGFFHFLCGSRYTSVVQ